LSNPLSHELPNTETKLLAGHHGTIVIIDKIMDANRIILVSCAHPWNEFSAGR
jgi:hypothetical protein